MNEHNLLHDGIAIAISWAIRIATSVTFRNIHLPIPTIVSVVLVIFPPHPLPLNDIAIFFDSIHIFSHIIRYFNAFLF